MAKGVDIIFKSMKLGKYQHYKGNFYRVIGIAKHSETLEDIVVYEPLYSNPKSKLWVRPKKMFLEKIKINGKTIPRFKFVDYSPLTKKSGGVK